MTDSYSIRPVRSRDLDLIVSHRECMFREMGRPAAELEVMRPVFREWLEPRLADGTYFGWITEFEGTPTAGLGMMILDWPPRPWARLHSKCLCGTGTSREGAGNPTYVARTRRSHKPPAGVYGASRFARSSAGLRKIGLEGHNRDVSGCAPEGLNLPGPFTFSERC